MMLWIAVSRLLNLESFLSLLTVKWPICASIGIGELMLPTTNFSISSKASPNHKIDTYNKLCSTPLKFGTLFIPCTNWPTTGMSASKNKNLSHFRIKNFNSYKSFFLHTPLKAAIHFKS